MIKVVLTNHNPTFPARQNVSHLAPETPAVLSGVFPVFQTPFHENESINWETLERELHWLLDRGANGVVMAMVSEVLRTVDPRAA